MFLEALFIGAPNWKQLKCPLSGEWTNQQRYSHAKEYYSAIKRTELLIPTTTWTKSKALSEVARYKSYMLYYSIYISSFKRQTMKRKLRVVIAKAENQGRMLTVKGQEEFLGVMEMFCILIMVTTLYICQKSSTYLKGVNLIFINYTSIHLTLKNILKVKKELRKRVMTEDQGKDRRDEA